MLARPCILLATLGLVAGLLHAGERLYNGIELPDTWPPARSAEEFKNREPQPVPYLKLPPAVISIDLGRQLFVDDFLVESTTLRREFQVPHMHPESPLVKPDVATDREGKSPMAMPFSDGVWFDPKDRLFKMWYLSGYGVQTALAVSRDGVHWEKSEFDVRPGTNVVQTEARDSSTVWLDLEERDPERRFKMWRYQGGGLSLHFSADGIHWSSRVLRTGPTGDRTTVFWNPFRKIWVYSVRHVVEPSRARRYWETKDLFAGPQWRRIDEPTMWLISDRLDPPRDELKVEPQLYNFDAVAYESLMVGFFTIWRGDKNIPPGRPKPNSIFLGFSRDGFHWDRPDRRPFIPVSEEKGDWNWGNVQSVGGGCLVVGDELWFYFSGRAGSDDGKSRDGNGGTGLAILRRDGFAAMKADEKGGELTTRPLRFSGAHLFVNVAATHGEFSAEVLDRDGKVVPPFTRENCVVVRGDKTRAAVTWKGAANLANVAGQPLRFRFQLKNGALYSFWVSRDPSGASGGYVAAGGPGFAGPTDAAAAPH